MRQPEKIQITPSRPNPWYGRAGAADRFTHEQLHGMSARGLDPATVETLTVKRTATATEMWWPSGDAAPVFEFECPVLHRRPDGRVKVLAPAGWPKIVFGDGWVRRPKLTRRRAY